MAAQRPATTAGVAVVTDSTAALPPGWTSAHDVVVVPLQVTIGPRTGLEGVDVSPADVAAELTERRVRVTTSQPSPAAFQDAFERAARGHAGVVAVHLSAALSGTCDAARLVAREVTERTGTEVRVVDSRSVVMGLGFVVRAAAEAAAAGSDLAAVEAAAVAAVERTTTLFYVDTLEHLRRGGRIGAAAALVGAALAVKPILHVVGGSIAPLEKVRTATRALARLEDLAVAAAEQDECSVAVHHLAAAARAEEIAGRLAQRLPKLRDIVVTEVGAVVGAHAGPGLLGVVVHRW